MANYTGGIEFEGLDKVLKKLDKTGEVVRKAAMEGLQKGALSIIADAMQNLRANGSVVTGLLRQSGKVQKKDETTLEAGFFDTKNKSGYAAWVEYGRKSGKMPPPDELAAYAYKKFRLKDWREARAIGWVMAKKIAKQGTKPHPFFQPAISKNTRRILDSIRDAINKATNVNN